MEIISITDNYSVSGELNRNTIEKLANLGVGSLINVRPDGEAQGQMSSREYAAICQDFGLTYIHIPVTSGEYSDHIIAEFKLAIHGDLEQAKVHCVCRTGTRAVHLWALMNRASKTFEALNSLTTPKGYELIAIKEQFIHFCKKNR